MRRYLSIWFPEWPLDRLRRARRPAGASSTARPAKPRPFVLYEKSAHGLTVAVANGINQAILGRSFFQAQLESRGIVLHEGPHRTIMKDIRVSDIMRPLADDEPKELPEGDRERALTTDETLESALRAFDTLGAESLPVVAPHDRGQVLGRAEQVRALRVFNRELIAASVEEHR